MVTYTSSTINSITILFGVGLNRVVEKHLTVSYIICLDGTFNTDYILNVLLLNPTTFRLVKHKQNNNKIGSELIY